MLARNDLGLVCASGVHHDDFVRDALERGQGARQIVFFVEGDQASGEAIHRVRRRRNTIIRILHSRSTALGCNFEKHGTGKPASFFLEADTNAALANAKLRAV